MGTVAVKMQVANPADLARQTTLELIVDTGAVYSIIPAPVLRELGIEPWFRKRFRTADGRSIERAFAEASFIHNGEHASSRVIFGDEADAAILGVHALEGLGLQVDPLTGQLNPSTLFLYWKRPKATVKLSCPHCQAKLTIDPELQAVLEHEPPPKKSDYDFDQQLKGLSEAERKREELFRQSFAAEKDRSTLLDRKFEEGLKKAKDEPITKPLRPIDLD